MSFSSYKLGTTQTPSDCEPTGVTVLDFIRQRQVGYVLGEDESPICDYYLEAGWYSVYGYVLATTPEACGTTYNWYSKGKLFGSLYIIHCTGLSEYEMSLNKAEVFSCLL